eukprot:3938106-Rhodomonas_salina.3
MEVAEVAFSYAPTRALCDVRYWARLSCMRQPILTWPLPLAMRYPVLKAVIEQAKVVRAAGAELKNLLRFEIENNGNGAPIDCLTWKVLKRNYEKEITVRPPTATHIRAMSYHYLLLLSPTAIHIRAAYGPSGTDIRRAKEVSGVARKLMKGVIKIRCDVRYWDSVWCSIRCAMRGTEIACGVNRRRSGVRR